MRYHCARIYTICFHRYFHVLCWCIPAHMQFIEPSENAVKWNSDGFLIYFYGLASSQSISVGAIYCAVLFGLASWCIANREACFNALGAGLDGANMSADISPPSRTKAGTIRLQEVTLRDIPARLHSLQYEPVYLIPAKSGSADLISAFQVASVQQSTPSTTLQHVNSDIFIPQKNKSN